jgi:hypothetical protein
MINMHKVLGTVQEALVLASADKDALFMARVNDAYDQLAQLRSDTAAINHKPQHVWRVDNSYFESIAAVERWIEQMYRNWIVKPKIHSDNDDYKSWAVADGNFIEAYLCSVTSETSELES